MHEKKNERYELNDEHVAAICRVLIDHGVQFVIIGGMAARLHDTGHATVDVDICPSTDQAWAVSRAARASPLNWRVCDRTNMRAS